MELNNERKQVSAKLIALLTLFDVIVNWSISVAFLFVD